MKDHRIIFFEVRENMSDKWKIDTPTGYWYPLDGSRPNDTIFFDFKTFEQELGLEKLKNIICVIEKNKIYELNETFDDDEIDIRDIDIRDDLIEQYYTCKTFDWVIYKSHESTITFAGNILVQQIKNEWKDWEKYAEKL